MRRRPLLSAALLGIAGRADAQSGAAQPAPWPSRPLTLLVPYVAGGPSDVLARAVAGPLGAAIGQNVVVENRPGGNGAVAAQATLRAPADGHTLFIAASGILTVNPWVMAHLPYDPVRDFAPLTIAIAAPNLLVAHPSFPPNTVAETIDWLKANPAKGSYGTSGIGSAEHLTMELFAQRTGTQVTHVPYGGGAAAMTDMLAGTTMFSFLNIATVTTQVQAGALKGIAVSGLERHPLFPAVPTVAETLPGFEGGSWHSLVAAAGTPEPVLARLNAALVQCLRLPEVEARLIRIGFSVVASSRAEMAARVAAELARWKDVVRAAGIQPA